MLPCSRTRRFFGVVAASLLMCLVGPASGQVAHSDDGYTQNVKRFDYDRSAPLDVKEIAAEKRGDVTVHDITYQSEGGTVPAYLVVPAAKGKFAAIVWGHWMMPHSPTANRKEFLDEAVALAPTGVVSLLIDTPQVRPGFQLEHKPGESAAIFHQQLIDLRRGIDLLASRSDVDPKRIAYVGHSFDSAVGAVLDAVDKRPAAFVFMGGPTSMREFAMSNAPEMVAMRSKTPPAALEAYLNNNAWVDPGTYATHLGPAPALFQYGLHDDYAPVPVAKQYFAAASGPKEVKFYDSGHALNAEARRDRVQFLEEKLGLSKLPPEAIDKVPATQ